MPVDQPSEQLTGGVQIPGPDQRLDDLGSPETLEPPPEFRQVRDQRRQNGDRAGEVAPGQFKCPRQGLVHPQEDPVPDLARLLHAPADVVGDRLGLTELQRREPAAEQQRTGELPEIKLLGDLQSSLG